MIGILTQPLHNNYGGLLQAYALCKVLIDHGYHPLVINRGFERPNLIRKSASISKRLILKIFINENSNHLFYAPSKKEKAIISQNTNEFIKKYIPRSKEYKKTSQLKQLINKGFNTFIVGSDQVWRPKYSPKITNYFLDFTIGQNINRISYAASFGVDHMEFSLNEKLKCYDLIQKFNAVSVREDSGVMLCKKYFNVNAIQVLDPTLLLTTDDYIRIVEDEKEPTSPGNLLVYILDKTNEKDKLIENYSKILRLTPFFIQPKKLDKATRNRIEDCIFPTVTCWLRGFIDAEFVITDSFHGCVFSILFNKPFVVIGNDERGMSRFNSLLRMFNLEDRLLHNPIEPPNYSIDWTTVNEILRSKRKLSIDYLIKNLTL